jgi:4a-hydroxytetrahydrobiopterin dehydratase
MTNFLEQKCAQSAAAMNEPDIHSHLAQMSGWREASGAIEKSFAFKNWLETVAFVDALAWVCHVEDHHPDLRVSYDRCVVRFSTHSAGGISRNDFICAAKADALVAFVG